MGTSSKVFKGLFNIVECTTVCLRVIHEQIIVSLSVEFKGHRIDKKDDFWVKISSSRLIGTRCRS